MSAISAGIPYRAGAITISQRTPFLGVALSPPKAITRCRSSLAPRVYRPFPRGTMQRYHTAYPADVLKCIEVY